MHARARIPGHRVPLVIMLVAGLVMLGLMAPATAGMSRPGEERGKSLSARARGLVYAGLRKIPGGPCGDLYQLDVPGRGPICTHGPDPAPAGVDVSVAGDIAPDVTTADATGGTVPCISDGVSGQRVQAIYAVASDRADRYATILPSIVTWAGQMDGAMNQSAAETGGERHVRFVTTADCTLNVAHVTLSPTGDDSFGNTVTELRNLGFTATDRKYLIWTDAGIYCGIAQMPVDDTAGATNRSNTSAGYARVDTGCWGRTDHLSELHEFMHTLGAVQLSAPHTTGNYHCTDEYDAMCYSDGAGVTLTYTCPSTHEWLLDCNHDDYFSTAPAAGSYLATHWNTADSVFLSGALDSSPAPSPSPTPSPTPTITTSTFTGSVSAKKPVKTFVLSVGGGDTVNALQFSASGKNKAAAALRLRIIGTGGTVLGDTTGPSVVRLTRALSADAYTWEVSGKVSASFTLQITYVAP